MLRLDIRRTQHHAAGNAIELDQRESRGQLVPCEKHHALVAQLFESTSEARGVCQVGQRNALSDAMQPPGRQTGGVYGLPERVSVIWQSVRTA